jgi:signal transduction histidine kinase
MSSAPDPRRDAADAGPPRAARAFGLRLGLWYAALFVIGSMAIVLLTYVLTASSLAERDRQIIQAKLGEYAAVYAHGGIPALADTVRGEQATAPERLFVRIAGGGTEAFVGTAEGWDPNELEIGSLQMADGTLVQVGKSTEARREVLARFRAALGLVTLSIVFVAITGGLLVTRSAVEPIRQLNRAVRRIIRTGRTDARVPVDPRAGPRDAIGELTDLFNLMLDRIERLVAAMRASLDNVSHDLRTPLTHLRGAAEMALAGPADPERYREALADCVEETDRVLVMLETLMDISEAESGTIELRREPVRLAEVAARAVDLYHDAAEARGVALALDGAGSEVVVEGDRTRLEQVAANLIDNAVKYTPPGGRVEVRVGEAGGAARLDVRDTGAGIPPDELPHIWDRLFRGDASRSARGLGLGLSLVRAIVEAHDGQVSATSRPGQGSTFEVRLPLQGPPHLSQV